MKKWLFMGLCDTVIDNFKIPKLENMQDNLYEKINGAYKENGKLVYLCSFPVSVVDVTLDVIKIPYAIIASVALAAINLKGIIYLEDDANKKFFESIVMCCVLTLSIPGSIIDIPYKVFYKTFNIINSEGKAESIRNFRL